MSDTLSVQRHLDGLHTAEWMLAASLDAARQARAARCAAINSLRDDGLTYRHIAADAGMSPSAIWHIVHGSAS
ncbi:hypothetical protein [Mycolicibacter arupensis]|uniref:Uncharacterized protein n=1 Tax=Mycolicibacter arupensis TaxID=342002 RepID=A0A5C7Y235_9MYCO|nr:hypothetical protein [Mycolicibacter arupensis]TXI55929.1 MAG: hypothetical protein E6Q54_11930 [Mycolicibacter arupensis]